MYQLLTLLLLWHCTPIIASAIDRTRSTAEIQSWIEALPALVEGSTLQNDVGLLHSQEVDKRKRVRMHVDLFDHDENPVVPEPRIINGVSVSTSFTNTSVFSAI